MITRGLFTRSLGGRLPRNALDLPQKKALANLQAGEMTERILEAGYHYAVSDRYIAAGNNNEVSVYKARSFRLLDFILFEDRSTLLDLCIVRDRIISLTWNHTTNDNDLWVKSPGKPLEKAPFPRYCIEIFSFADELIGKFENNLLETKHVNLNTDHLNFYTISKKNPPHQLLSYKNKLLIVPKHKWKKEWTSLRIFDPATGKDRKFRIEIARPLCFANVENSSLICFSAFSNNETFLHFLDLESEKIVFRSGPIPYCPRSQLVVDSLHAYFVVKNKLHRFNYINNEMQIFEDAQYSKKNFLKQEPLLQLRINKKRAILEDRKSGKILKEISRKLASKIQFCEGRLFYFDRLKGQIACEDYTTTSGQS